MGNIFGYPKSKEAIETLEDIIWDCQEIIRSKDINSVLENCNIFTDSALSDIKKHLSMKEKEHETMGNAFLKNNVMDLYSHHILLSRRYRRVVFFLQYYWVL
jgi:hypothetical protein